MSNYEYSIDTADINSTHARQLRLIGTAKRVLEVGSASGEMTRLLKAQQCRVTAIEIDPVAAEAAAAHADVVILADLEDCDLPATAGGEFDVVLLGDVLEHLRQPGSLLRSAAAVLAETGYVVASVPNVAHGSIRLALMQGRFPRGNYGLLDRTHLSFFERTSLGTLFEEAGFHIARWERVRVDPFQTEIELDRETLPAEIIHAVYADDESSTYQYVIVAVPEDRTAPLDLPRDPLPLQAPQWVSVREESSASADPGAGPAPSESVRTIAFYLPQFHRTPYNDAWWGPGFTEWTNVMRARPLFPGHHQPHMPGDLGFYDIRLSEIRERQAQMARAAGIHGFCYYHYWFGGRRMLEEPLDEVRTSGQPEFPFALCWANDPWGRHWGDHHDEVLVSQRYDGEELARHARWLADAFCDPRYISIERRPLFFIYNVADIPGARSYVEKLKELCVLHGSAEPYVVKAETWGRSGDPGMHGCDAEVEFPPHDIGRLVRPVTGSPPFLDENFIFDYEQTSQAWLDRPDVPWVRFRCVTPGWDNTPRRLRKGATVLIGSTPQRYSRWLHGAVEREARRPGGGLVLINAWNEWAEGAYLEPDEYHGTAYLDATARVLGAVRTSAGPASPPAPRPPATSSFRPDYIGLYERCVDAELESEARLRRIEELQAELAELRGGAGSEETSSGAESVMRLKENLVRAHQHIAELEDTKEGLIRSEGEARAATEYLLATRTFRYTAGLRTAYGRLRRALRVKG